MTLPGLPMVSFVVPVRNDARRLERCLLSLRRARCPAGGMEIIVLDNGSTDGSDRVALAAGARLEVLPDLRVAELRNRGAAAATGEILAFVDADHEVDEGWIEAAVETLRHPGISAVGAPYDAPANGTWVQAQYDRLRRRHAAPLDVEWLGSGNLAVWQDTFHQVGGFDLTLHTCEDVDLCQRIRAAGGRIVSDPRLKSTHHGDPATLRELFAGELWRGRDNIRVSLRRPLGWRTVVSALLPLSELALLAVALVGFLRIDQVGVQVGLAAIAGIIGLTVIQTARMLRASPAMSITILCQTFAVAGVFGLARALALVARAPHQVRQQRGR